MAYDEQKQAYQLAYIIRYLIFCAEKKQFLQYDDMRRFSVFRVNKWERMQEMLASIVIKKDYLS